MDAWGVELRVRVRRIWRTCDLRDVTAGGSGESSTEAQSMRPTLVPVSFCERDEEGEHWGGYVPSSRDIWVERIILAAVVESWWCFLGQGGIVPRRVDDAVAGVAGVEAETWSQWANQGQRHIADCHLTPPQQLLPNWLRGSASPSASFDSTR